MGEEMEGSIDTADCNFGGGTFSVYGRYVLVRGGKVKEVVTCFKDVSVMVYHFPTILKLILHAIHLTIQVEQCQLASYPRIPHPASRIQQRKTLSHLGHQWTISCSFLFFLPNATRSS